MAIVDIKGVGKAQFPDGMSVEDIRAFLRKKYTQDMGATDVLAPMPNTAQPYQPTLAEKVGQGLSDALYDSGVISDRYGAQQVGSTLSSIGEMLPGIGDATAGDEFGRAVAKDDYSGMALAGIGAIPVVGKAAKSAITKAKASGFDVGSVYRHDPQYRNTNADTDPIFEITEGEGTNFDGLFTNKIEYNPDDIRNNDFFVKKKASHKDFSESFYGDIGDTEVAIDYELPGYEDLTDKNKRFINDALTESNSNIYDFVNNATDELPSWVTELFDEVDTGLIEWEIQRIRGQIAKHKGFDAVDMKDETGLSTLILSTEGAKNTKDVF